MPPTHPPLISPGTFVTRVTRLVLETTTTFIAWRPVSRGGTLEISGWGCAAGTLEPLTYTRASSAEFFYPILE